MPAADCSVGFAHGIDSLVPESGDIWRFFSWAEPTLRRGRGRLKSWGDRFQTTCLYLKLHMTTFLNIIVLIVNHDVILVLVV